MPSRGAPIGQSTGTVVLPSRASGTPRELGAWNSPRSPRITSSSAVGPRQKTVTPRSPLAMATGEETFSAIADQRRGFVTAAMILQFESPTLGGRRRGDRRGRWRSSPRDPLQRVRAVRQVSERLGDLPGRCRLERGRAPEALLREVI